MNWTLPFAIGLAAALAVAAWFVFSAGVEPVDVDAPSTAVSSAPEPEEIEPAPSVTIEPSVASAAPVVAVVSDEDERLDLPPAALLTSSVRVRTEGPDGEPLPHVALRLRAGLLDDLLETPTPFEDFEVEATSDASGLAALAVPRLGVYTVHAQKDGYAAGALSPLLPGDEVTLRLEESHSLSGLLVDAESRDPIADAWIRVNGHGENQLLTTDPDGRFEAVGLAPGRYRVEAIAAGYDVESARDVPVGSDGVRDEEFTIELERGALLTGTVKEMEGGAPIEAALVVVRVERRIDGDSRVLIELEGVTDDMGRYQIEGVPRYIDAVASADGFARRFRRAKKVSNPHTLDFDLPASSFVAGVVRDENGAPVAGARVSLAGISKYDVKDRRVKSDAEGRFRFDEVRPGVEFDLVASADEVAESLASTVLDGLQADGAGSLEELEVVLRTGGAIEGVVVDGFGEPVPWARVIVDGIDPGVWKIRREAPIRYADGEGAFAIRGLTDGAVVRLVAVAGDDRASPVERAVASGATERVELVLEQGEVLAGVVSDPLGQPLDDVVVTVFAHKDEVVVPSLPPSPPPSAATPGKKKKVKKSKRKDAPRGEIQVGGKSISMTRLLKKGGDPTERVIDVLAGGRHTRSLAFRALDRSEADGRFALTGLAAGEGMVLVARHPDYAPYFELSVAAGDLGKRIELSPKLSLTGLVLDGTSNRPIDEFQISVQPIEEETASTVDGLISRPRGQYQSFNSVDGTFRMEGLQPGRYEISAGSRDYIRSKPLVIQIGQGYANYFSVRLTRSSSVSGRVDVPSGAGVPGIRVFLRRTVTGPTKNSEKPWLSIRKTGRSGSFLFRDVPPGRYEVGLGTPKRPVGEVRPIRVDLGETVEQRFKLEAFGSLDVRVLGLGGFGLERANVKARGRQTQFGQVHRTGEDGGVRFDALPADEYQVEVSRPGYEATRFVIRVGAGDQLTRAISLTKSN